MGFGECTVGLCRGSVKMAPGCNAQDWWYCAGSCTSGVQPSCAWVSPGGRVHDVDSAAFEAQVAQASHDNVSEVHVCVLDEEDAGIEPNRGVIDPDSTARGPIQSQVQIGYPHCVVIVHKVFEYCDHALSVCTRRGFQRLRERLRAVSLRRTACVTTWRQTSMSDHVL